MIKSLDNIPQHIAGFGAIGEVTKEDYQDVLAARIAKLAEEQGEINFLFLMTPNLRISQPVHGFRMPLLELGTHEMESGGYNDRQTRMQ